MIKKITITIGVILSIVMLSCTEDTIDVVQKGNLSGLVLDKESGNPLEGIKISTSPASVSAITDENGEFELLNILVDDYSVQAEGDDYVTAFEPVTVLANENATVSIEMVRKDAENDPPLVPILVSPEDNAIDVPATVQFVWHPSDNDADEITYNLELRNGNTNEIMLVENLSDTTHVVENLDRGVNYFWQVIAKDGVNDGVSSVISGFRTAVNATDNRYYFVKKIGDNEVIFSGTDSPNEVDNPDENLIQITDAAYNSFRPRQNTTANKVAFLRTVGPNTHLFIMDRDGSNVQQLTLNVPVAGFRQDEVDFTWYQNGNKLYYPHFNRIYSIANDGTGNSLVYTAPEGTFVTEIDTNEANNLIAIKTNDASGYNARIVVINPSTGEETSVVVSNIEGALGGIDFSIDGTKVLYTRDVSGYESIQYRQLDSRIFIYELGSELVEELDTDKPAGTNDLDAKFSPDEGSVIFVNTSNDGISPKQIVQVTLDTFNEREVIFTNAYMPDWE